MDVILYGLSEAKLKARSEDSRQKNNKEYFYAKLCFSLLALRRSAIFLENKVENQVPLYPKGLTCHFCFMLLI
jgi:hypothetical protein